jgi:hypothetical protein
VCAELVNGKMGEKRYLQCDDDRRAHTLAEENVRGAIANGGLKTRMAQRQVSVIRTQKAAMDAPKMLQNARPP